MLNPKDTWNPKFKDLSDRAKSCHSQYGEDGLIEAIFEICPPQNKHCIEVGAADGVTISNTKCFIDQGWKALLIESIYETIKDGQLFSGFRKIVENYSSNQNVVPIWGTLTKTNLNDLLQFYNWPQYFDLLSLDIDSFDAEVWQNLIYRPNLIVIECNDEDRSMQESFYELGNPHNAASVEYLKTIAHLKGYEFICATVCNAFFIEPAFAKPLYA